MKRWLFYLLLLITAGQAYGQTRKPKPAVRDTVSGEAFIQMVDKAVEDFYQEFVNDPNFNKIIDELEAVDNTSLDFPDEVYCERLNRLSQVSSFPLDCNPITLATIRFFSKNRRSFATIVLGRSKLYFDMYEHYLVKYDLPKELKYLSVIESGLRPQVKSPAGALGLWQFMYGTGKMYGLKDNSYMDERMDPHKSTDAACRYLKKLYGIYNDWNLALAAYNAGPGNINKAIKRSGGKRTYWEIRPFLPRETQNYVPNFIAATYLLTYHKEHKITPAPTKTHFYLTDTICLKKGVNMSVLSSLADWPVEDIKMYNPVFKGSYIPQMTPNVCISGPLDKIGRLVTLEDSLYKIIDSQNIATEKPVSVSVSGNPDSSGENTQQVEVITYKYHKIKPGETLAKIAQQHKTTSSELMRVNRLKSAHLQAGKTLKIPQKTIKTITSPKTGESGSENGPVDSENAKADTAVIINHVVQRNESLIHIAEKYNVSIDDIKQWNGLKDNWLNIGQKLIIHQIIKFSKDIVTEQPIIKAVTPLVEQSKPLPKPAAQVQHHVVKSGELFNRIAARYGLTQSELQRLNPGIKPDRIAVGQKIRVK